MNPEQESETGCHRLTDGPEFTGIIGSCSRQPRPNMIRITFSPRWGWCAWTARPGSAT